MTSVARRIDNSNHNKPDFSQMIATMSLYRRGAETLRGPKLHDLARTFRSRTDFRRISAGSNAHGNRVGRYPRLLDLSPAARHLSTKLDSLQEETLSDDERVQKLGKAYHDEYSSLRESYGTPKHPIVLCHGLLGFDSMRIGEIEPLSIPPLAVIHYWKGIKEALEANGNEVFITRVPRTATVEERAEILAKQIQDHFGGRSINLIGHSMVSKNYRDEGVT